MSTDIRSRHFEGDVEELSIDGEPIGLWNTRNRAVNVHAAERRPATPSASLADSGKKNSFDSDKGEVQVSASTEMAIWR